MPRQIASWPIEPIDKIKFDRVATCHKNDRGCSLGCNRARCRSCCDNHLYLMADQIVGESWQPIVVAFCPAEYDGHAFAFDIAGTF
jgi:hypothetical protein